MPEHCAAFSCCNRRTIESRARGITFHKFPKDKDMRKKWEVALRREGFHASDASVLCSHHFKQGDFDRTGQIVRLRDGVIPSVFSFPVHLQRLEKGRATSTSRGAEESLSVSLASQDSQETATSSPQPQPNDDHGYALPASPTTLKTRLNEALARVERLEREKKNSMAREKRAKTTVKSLLGDLREKNLINEELKEKLEFYSDLQIDLMAKQGQELDIFPSHIHIQYKVPGHLPPSDGSVWCLTCYLPTRFGGLVENALVYVAGFVVRQILRKLSCDVCRASLVRDARPASFEKSYHLLALKNNGGTVKVLRAAEKVIRQASAI
ncbi:hypothetical protein QQF64_034415 [Cirrhinus molitorella]|uniref:THAP-type domain-containing protein n=1 Tax=Cirrhinus molitorella TaxID=172907 RepID=A0ABR3L5V0_9TELE